ncbi:flagellar biosynthetic protein FliR [Kosakonia radicincitans DSM 16656]|uniref:Flagellar biosynthetic protein FliR n=1 Tax=Kosakonia radicincitans TaxID=283686 RepID=A0AAX2EQR0_9ENTR|nr:flagellar biosynthetic protein FliR [Kosakonia radicincitans]MDP9566127.1 flagellar biosynthetic protein FliR [Kosakonia oryzae]ARD59523.1 flagellar biosynthetic protein FliR [Kosakonia radicincitans DSM 16656]MDD7996517.1 flagellar biosynthetic protein FliR [Kosakonia radicincitans]QEM90313.1 flagellar biosynthetic protein FliR [Kosakonia radicincitans]SFE15278.1 flagellar biosynthetic protein FliR [Kosakonia radicincitans]
MLTLSLASLYPYVNHYFWPCLRILALLGTAPIFSEKQINARIKIALALVSTFLIAPQLPDTGIAIASLDGLMAGCQQLIIGIAIGFSVQLIFVAVRHAGELVGMQMGLSMAMVYDPSGGTNMPVVARLLNLCVTLLFLVFNGHLYLLEVVASSFNAFPVSAAPMGATGMMEIVREGRMIFQYGFMLGLPVITLLLCLNLTLGLLNRLTPQLSIFIVGFPVSLTVGMVAMSLVMYTLAPFFENMMAGIFDTLFIILKGFG